MGFTLLAEWLSIGIKAAECLHDLPLFCAKLTPTCAQRDCIGCLFWTVAPIAPARIRRANGSTSCMGNRTKAWCAMRDHHADCSSQFALHADTMCRCVRFASMQVSANHLY